MILFLQTLLLCVAGAALFRLWRMAMPQERWVQWVVSAGFLLRAIPGQLLFWISWARLPVARSLQLGNGFWIFAQDSTFYFPEAEAAARAGWRAILFYPRGAASPAYMQLLSATIWFLGGAVAVGLLINLVCYTGTIAILVRWSRHGEGSARPFAMAIAAISLSPAFILWSLQALKDTFFQFVFVAFIAACAAWERSWRESHAWRERFASGALLPILLFTLAGLRWYVAAALLVAAIPFLLLLALQSVERIMVSLAAIAVVVFLLSRSLLISAGPYLTPAMTAALKFSTAGLKRTPSTVLTAVAQTRQFFDGDGASTSIEPGPLLSSNQALQQRASLLPRVPPPPAPPMGDRSQTFSAADEKRIRSLFETHAAEWSRNNLGAFMGRYWNSPELVVIDGPTTTRGFDRVSDIYRSRFRDALGFGQLSFVRVQIAGNGDVASVSGRWRLVTTEGLLRPSMFVLIMRRFPNEGWKITREEFTPSRLIVRTPPEPRSDRLIAGIAALLLPQPAGRMLGLFKISGGRGLLWFADIDTLLFDAVLLFVFIGLWRRRSLRWWGSPLTWLLLIATSIMTLVIAYSIGNFGTLFRLREIIFLGMLLIPAASVCSRSTPSS